MLDLAGSPETNRIKDISPLKSLSMLRQINLTGNQISDISPLIDLPHLKDLLLIGNPLSAESRDLHIPRLKEKGVNIIH